MQPQLAQTKHDDLMSAYRDGLFTESDFLEAAGKDFGALAERSIETALRMADAFSGIRLYIPMQLSDKPGAQMLKETLGEEGAQIVMSVYQGEFLPVPRLMSLRQSIQRRKVAALHADGWSATRLAQRFQRSERQIYSILRRCREEAALKQS